ncbi:hypothetical protein HNY73_019134 [Argiope bruennichi]|uniref:Uncharacterized protein n=1 Tax=Argiope bruennichi TaxID=94029 RepID=A0A8T0EFW3_ARGBR|nr:hypothetical protein HNY73_019134 [Argiope bruennichi]
MESNLKGNKIVLRKVAQDVLLLVLFKHEMNQEKRKLRYQPEIVMDFINNLSDSVWTESCHNELRWKDFFNNHFKRMTTTPYLFANYVAYACYLSNKCVTDAFESCLITLSIVIYFVLQCWLRERKEFFNSCVDLFCAFFKKEIRTKFEDQGGWQKFIENLENLRTMKNCNQLANANQPVYELLKEYQNKHLESEEPYDIDGVVLKDITETQVETHQEAVTLAESVADKMKELCKKTFEEVLIDFEKLDKQIKETLVSMGKMLGEASSEISKKEEQALFRKAHDEASENNSSVTNSEKRKLQIKTETTSDLVAQNSNNINFQDGFLDIEALHLKQKSRKSERTKKLLSDLSMDIARISELVMFLCDENGIRVPIQVVDTNANS